jgi:ankyrin repeat protein
MSSSEKLVTSQELPQRLPWSETAVATRLLNTLFSKPDCSLLRCYIKKGFDCKMQQQEQPRHSLLHLVAGLDCVDCDKVKLVQSLVKRGAALDARDCVGVTPLMLASINNNDAVVSGLLAAGADVHTVCIWQRTALHCAAETISPTTTSLLLAAGASATAMCDEGANSLHLACRQYCKQLDVRCATLVHTSINSCWPTS